MRLFITYMCWGQGESFDEQEQNMVRALKKILNTLEKIEIGLIYILLPAMCIIILANTFARYTGLFTNYLVWAEELARYIMIYMAFIGSALVMQTNGHYKMTAVVDVLPQKAGAVVKVLALMITLAFAVFLAKVGFDCCIKIAAMGQKTPILKIPMAVPYASIPVGMILGAVQLCLSTIVNAVEIFSDKEREKT